MPEYSKKSSEKLNTCHLDLQKIFKFIVKHFDNTILEGYRDEEKQNYYYKKKKSKVKFPLGKHNKLPSEAVDSIPYPIDWRFEGALLNAIRKGANETEIIEIVENIERWFMYVGFVRGVAAHMGIKIRCGADWNSNNIVSDQKFDDLPHFELIESSQHG